ncbi:MAG: DegV family protein [Lachnospiraceae bacterium]
MYKIVIDSCCDMTDKMRDSDIFDAVPLGIELGDYRLQDDENFNQLDFLKRVRLSPVGPKSSCPSPERYMQSYIGETERVYVVTLSDKLSGSYNSAVLATNLFSEENKSSEKNLHVFNSKSASCGETLIALKIQECEEAGMPFQEVVDQVEAYIAEQETFFILETLETLRKNGRLSNLKAFVASALNIKPIMGSTPEGEICQLGQSRGMTKALKKMGNMVIEKTKNCEEKILAIAHCNCPDRAQTFKEEILKLAEFKEIIIVNTAGISSMYANDGGIIVAV